MRFRGVLADKNVLFVLKAINLVVITAYSFAMVYILVRVLSIETYSIAVLISSAGIYIMASDLGYSGFIYYRTRQSFLTRAEPHGSEAESFALYMAIALAAALVMAVALFLFFPVPVDLRLAFSLYFLSIVLALPWGLIRKIAAAMDLYVSFEFYEVIRRVFFLVMAGMMLFGLPFIAFTLICLLAWAAAFVRALHMLRSRRKMSLLTSSPGAVRAHVRANFNNLWHSGSLTVLEFVLYNFPYIAIPLLFTDKTLIVAFDIFYKVVRFGAVSYSVPADSFLPAQTRAFYADDAAGVVRYYRRSLLIGTLPLAACAVVLIGFGEPIFATLLSRGGIVDHAQRVSMVAVLAAVLFQSTAGTFLLATGNYARLARLAAITLSLMAVAVAATWVLQLSFDTFIYLYVLAYCVHAAFYTGFLTRFIGSMAKGVVSRRTA